MDSTSRKFLELTSISDYIFTSQRPVLIQYVPSLVDESQGLDDGEMSLLLILINIIELCFLCRTHKSESTGRSTHAISS